MSLEYKAHYPAAANENLFGASPKVTAALQAAIRSLHSYPHPDAAPLREAIALKLGIAASEVVIGSGSAELISLLIRTFCQPFSQTNVLSVSPTYPLYRLEAGALGVQYKTAPLDSLFHADIDSLLAKVDAATRICFISNPNNPTGTYLSKAQLERLVYKLPPHITLVLDEAYLEYVTAPDYTDALPYLHERENLVILRTFSKAYGLASLRIGYMVAQQHLLTKVLQVKQPYNANQLAQIAAEAALQDEEFLTYTLRETAAGKRHLQEVLNQLGVQHWPSQGNFLYIDAGIPAATVYDFLQQHSIQVRQPDSKFGLRITIGTKQHQDYLSQILKALLNPHNLMQPQQLAAVLATGEAIAHLPETEAVAAARQLYTQVAPEGNAASRVAFAFARAFSARLEQSGHHAGNLYSSTYGTVDMISAFNVLIKATPLVTFGHLFSNLTIANAIANAPEVHLMDLGMGSGLQWFQLLDLLASRPGGAPRIRLTGIDIPASEARPDERLRMAAAALQQHALSLGIDFSYHVIAAKLEEIDLLQVVEVLPGETLVVNAAFTLHHIPDQLVSEQAERDQVLKQIKALQPKVFTLTEPDSEHNRLEFMPRLRESLRHYHTVFDVLDTLLPAQMQERQIIEQEFFGREIINVISCEGNARVERHERNESWQQRLIRNQFAPFKQHDQALELVELLQLHEHFTLKPNGAGLTLYWKGIPIVAATAWGVEGVI